MGGSRAVRERRRLRRAPILPHAGVCETGCGGPAAAYVGQGGRMAARGGARAARLRRTCGAVHAALGDRRAVRPVLHVGALGGPEVTYDAGDAPDLGLRAEIAAALVSRALVVVDPSPRPG